MGGSGLLPRAHTGLWTPHKGSRGEFWAPHRGSHGGIWTPHKGLTWGDLDSSEGAHKETLDSTQGARRGDPGSSQGVAGTLWTPHRGSQGYRVVGGQAKASEIAAPPRPRPGAPIRPPLRQELHVARHHDPGHEHQVDVFAAAGGPETSMGLGQGLGKDKPSEPLPRIYRHLTAPHHSQPPHEPSPKWEGRQTQAVSKTTRAPTSCHIGLFSHLLIAGPRSRPQGHPRKTRHCS